MSKNDTLRMGIIGVGNMGTGHAKNILAGRCPRIRLTAVADIAPARLAYFAKEISAEPARFSTAEEMLDSGLIDACIVAVPHYDHVRYAVACMQRGIHVMVEKPAGVYTAAVREMNAEADRHPDVVFGMMFNQRTDPVYRKLRELVQSGRYGRIRRVNWIITDWYRPQAYYNSGDWRATWSGEGGGVLLNQCPHQLDLLQWICGLPVRVDAHMRFGQWHDIEVEDDVTAYLEFEGGATGVFVTSTGDAHGTNRLEIQMDGARLIATPGRLSVLEYDESEPEFSAHNTVPFATVGAHEVPVATDGDNPQHVGVLNAFAGAVLDGTPLIADGREGIRGLTLSNAMHLSAFLGRPVEIPFDEREFYDLLMARVATSRRKTGGAADAAPADTAGTYGGTH